MRHLPHLRFTIVFAAVSCVTSMLPAWAGQAEDEAGLPKITAVRFWSMGDVTRIAIESTGEFRFKADRLHNPERIFFDLLGTKPRLDSQSTRGTAVIGVADRHVRQIRVAETQRSVTRVVFDVVGNIEYSTSQLANPNRMIIEFHSALTDRRVAVERPIITDRTVYSTPAPRRAHLDFSDLRYRRQEALIAMVPKLPEPPSPFDWSLRFATRPYHKIDPLEGSPLTRVRPVPPPSSRQTRVATVLAKTTAPPPIYTETVPALSDSPRVTPSASANSDIALPAKRTAEGDTMIRVLGLKLGRVVLDPGHGGQDAGTTGSEGLDEKDVALDVCKRLGVLIQERLGSEVVFTRTDDSFVSLSRRTAIANERKADLFLSIHVNSSPVRSVAGFETYYLNFTTSKSAMETAMRENAGADKNIGELQDVLRKIALKDKADESREFASRIQTSLSTLAPKSARVARDRGVKRAPFVVLIGASMPSVLAEIGFISNPQDESLMRRGEHRQRIAEALYKGVASYANSLSHFQVAQQSSPAMKSSSAGQ